MVHTISKKISVVVMSVLLVILLLLGIAPLQASGDFDPMLNASGLATGFQHYANSGWCTASRTFSYGSIAVDINNPGSGNPYAGLRYVSGDIWNANITNAEKTLHDTHEIRLAATVRYNVWINGNFEQRTTGLSCRAIITSWT